MEDKQTPQDGNSVEEPSNSHSKTMSSRVFRLPKKNYRDFSPVDLS